MSEHESGEEIVSEHTPTEKGDLKVLSSATTSSGAYADIQFGAPEEDGLPALTAYADTAKEAIEFAERVATACNAHDELVRVGNALCAELEYNARQSGRTDCQCKACVLLRELRAVLAKVAIAKAEGKS